MSDTKVYRLRMKPSDVSAVQQGLKDNFIVIGWSYWNDYLSKEKPSQMDLKKKMLGEHHYKKAEAEQYAGDVYRFSTIERDAMVVVPTGASDGLPEGFLIGVEAGPIRFVAKGMKSDTANRRQIRWLNDKRPFPLSAASEALGNKLKARNICIDISDLAEEIESLAKGKGWRHKAQSSKSSPKEVVWAFNPEFAGTKSAFQPKAVKPQPVLHGKVIKRLAKILEDAGLEIRNDQKIDLQARRNMQKSLLFEVKTSTDTQSIYTAVGQLVVHGLGLKGHKPILVLPSGPEADKWGKQLVPLGIRLLCYELQGEGSVEFNNAGLQKVLALT